MIRPIFIIFIILSINKAYGQTHEDIAKPFLVTMNPEAIHLPTAEATRHIGENVYVFDNIWGVKPINDTLKLLYVGGLNPKHLLTIFIKGKQAIRDLSYLKNGAASHFSGRLFIYEGKPAIIITSSLQTGVQITI